MIEFALRRRFLFIAFSLFLVSTLTPNGRAGPLNDIFTGAAQLIEDTNFHAPAQLIRHAETSTVLFNGQYMMFYRSFFDTNGNFAGGNITGISFATSLDGNTWTAYNGGRPVIPLGAGGVGSNGVYAPSVIVESNKLTMVYESDPGGGIAQRVATASSFNGTNWFGHQYIISQSETWEGAGTAGGGIGTPSLNKFGSNYYVFYHGYTGTDGAGSLARGFASGTSLTNLVKQSGNPVLRPTPLTWTDTGIGKGDIIEAEGYYYIVFEGFLNSTGCGSAFLGWGLGRSTNLVNWTYSSLNPFRTPGRVGCGGDMPEWQIIGTNIYLITTVHELLGEIPAVRRYKISPTPAYKNTKLAVAMASTPDSGGYWQLTSDGQVFPFGNAGFFGSSGGNGSITNAARIEATPSGNGYWIATSNGNVYAFGDANFYGSLNGTSSVPVAAMAVTTNGAGYWLATKDGRVFNFGNAGFFGELNPATNPPPIVSMAHTPTGNGYWLAATNGAVFNFGDAASFGSGGGGLETSALVATTNGQGYWLMTTGGKIFTFGNATSFGQISEPVNDAFITMRLSKDSSGAANGYWMMAGKGYLGAEPLLGAEGVINDFPANGGAVYYGQVRHSSSQIIAPAAAPTVLTPPQSQTALVGSNVTLTVLVGGNAPLSYQWRFNGNNLFGETRASFAITNAQPAHSGNYTVVATNVYGATTSAVAVLNVNYQLNTPEPLGGLISRSPDQPSFPTNTIVALTAITDPGFIFTGWSGDATGTNNPLNVTMNAHKTITANFSGTPPDLIIDNPQAAFTGLWLTGTTDSGKYGDDYRTILSGGSDTATFRSTVFTPGLYAIYIWHPQDLTATANAQWLVSHNGGSATTGVNQTSNSGAWRLIFTGKNFLRGTNGFVRLSNNTGEVAKNVIADAVKLVYGTPPFVIVPPQNQIVAVNSNATFAVTVSGSAPFTYQWRFGGTDISGATQSSYTLINAQPANEGAYSVIVSNIYGTTTSVAATLAVHFPPGIATQPQSQSVSQAVNVTFTVGASGTAPLGYQWRFNGVNISSANASSYTRVNVQTNDAGNYSVFITNLVGSVLSSNATLTVDPTPVAPSIATPPQNQLVIAGQTANFSVTANGTLPLAYQWLRNGAPISGATASTFALSNAQPTDAGTFAVIVSNSVSSITSASATLTIHFSLNTIAQLGGAVTRSPDQTSFAPNSAVTLSTVADPGFDFHSWSGDIISTNNPLAFTITSNMTLSAHFTGAVADLILDNPQASLSGTWSTGTSATNKYGSNYRFANTVSGAVTATATYRPTITTPGNYDVFVWYPHGSNRSTNAPWQVSSASNNVTVGINQTINGGVWVFVTGANYFSQGTNGFVRLSNNTSESGKLVMADATLFVFSGPPTLLSQPQDQTVFEGNTAGFNVIANSATPLSYQWQFNSVDIFGATSSSLVLSNAQFSQAGNYSVLVGNSAGTVTSAPAMLTVLPVVPPQFDAITLLPDQTVRLTLSGATGAIYAIEFSTNFSSWLPIANVTNQSGTVEFIDSETLSTQQMRYYRARVEP